MELEDKRRTREARAVALQFHFGEAKIGAIFCPLRITHKINLHTHRN